MVLVEHKSIRTLRWSVAKEELCSAVAGDLSYCRVLLLILKIKKDVPLSMVGKGTFLSLFSPGPSRTGYLPVLKVSLNQGLWPQTVILCPRLWALCIWCINSFFWNLDSHINFEAAKFFENEIQLNPWKLLIYPDGCEVGWLTRCHLDITPHPQLPNWRERVANFL